jgi:putative ABC transport system permease protein
MGRAMAWLTSLVAMIIGCVGVLNTMMMSVFERTHEIGVLRAMGWRKSRIIRMILFEALAVSLFGGTLGTLAAIVLTRLLAKLPTVAAIISGTLPLTIIAAGTLVACLVALLGSIYPAYRAARQLPTEALRHE